jgi:dTDP-N-acetylfucosamine:lipid II N-acetylfucosaminyltransferase
MILHLADDSTIIDYAIEQFEAVAPGKNVYLVNTSNPERIKRIDKIIACDPCSDNYTNTIRELEKYDAVVLHALTLDKAMIVNNARKGILFVWMLWGGDGFYITKFRGKWYSKRTQKILDINENLNIFNKIKRKLTNNYLYYIFFYLRKGHFPESIEKIKAMRKINYIAPVIEDDYYILKKKLGLKSSLLPFSYTSIEGLSPNYEFNNNNGLYHNNEIKILLGNSADPSNNHIDILYLLEDLKFEGDIICPLSYGGNPKYIERIIQIGDSKFGRHFRPLNTILPIDQYNKIIGTCNIVIMNHYRQQAMGNILVCLMQGSAVYLNKKNPAYQFLKRNGIKIFKIDEIQSLDSFADNKLSVDDIKTHTENILHIFSKEAVSKKTKAFINKIENHPDVPE